MAHVYHRNFTHFVWSTWDRVPLLEGEIERDAYALMRAQCTHLNVTVYAIGGVADHVHLLVSLPRTLCLSDLLESVKGVSSKALNDTHGSPTWAFRWQGSYSDHSVSPSHMRRIRLYIENQKQHHADNTLWPSCEPSDANTNNSDARAGGDLHH